MRDENPKRPVGYGCGVRNSQVFGVHATMRTGHYPTGVTNNSAEIESFNARMSAVHEENQAIRKENQELRSMVSQNNKILFQSALRMPNYEVCLTSFSLIIASLDFRCVFVFHACILVFLL